MRRITIWLSGLLIVLGAIFLIGPRISGDTTVTFDPSTIGVDPAAYVAASEAEVQNIRPGQAKDIVWARPDHSKTALAIVYVHGFSASSGEVRPLPDKVAQALGANLFFTRLTGHGQDGPAMATASVNAWVNDYAEAIAVGRAIGERVVIIAASTGGSLATLEAANPQFANDIAGVVMISPNYGIQAGGSFLLTMPWGKQIAEFIVGKERGFEPRNARQAEFWTTRYPTEALLPMARLVEIAVATPVEVIKTPALFIFSDKDRVVRPDITRKIAERWGGPHDTVIIDESGDPDMHVIAGDILSPSTTETLTERTVEWIKALP